MSEKLFWDASCSPNLSELLQREIDANVRVALKQLWDEYDIEICGGNISTDHIWTVEFADLKMEGRSVPLRDLVADRIDALGNEAWEIQDLELTEAELLQCLKMVRRAIDSRRNVSPETNSLT